MGHPANPIGINELKFSLVAVATNRKFLTILRPPFGILSGRTEANDAASEPEGLEKVRS